MGEVQRINEWERALAEADDPAIVIAIEAELAAAEKYMRDTGLYSTAEIRPVNELRMRARWKLGQLLAKVERGQGARTDLGSTLLGGLTKLIRKLGLSGPTAMEAQRIGAMPAAELEKALVEAHKHDALVHFSDLIKRARPWWYQASRQRRHREILAAAGGTAAEHRGPFPLIYADPPWTFEIYSEKGAERTPEQHYPVMSDADIEAFSVFGKPVREIAHRDAALLMWCTSSNLHRALKVLEAWGFTFKTSAVWVKDKTGLGLVFRNQHELLLYGTRGAMPGPQYQPPSVFAFPRGAHSAKPPQIRAEIERMYPDFDASTRLELFCRSPEQGWTSHGHEASGRAAA